MENNEPVRKLEVRKFKKMNREFKPIQFPNMIRTEKPSLMADKISPVLPSKGNFKSTKKSIEIIVDDDRKIFNPINGLCGKIFVNRCLVETQEPQDGSVIGLKHTYLIENLKEYTYEEWDAPLNKKDV